MYTLALTIEKERKKRKENTGMVIYFKVYCHFLKNYILQIITGSHPICNKIKCALKTNDGSKSTFCWIEAFGANIIFRMAFHNKKVKLCFTFP